MLAKAKQKALAEALAAKAQAVKESAAAGIAAGKSFKQALAGMDVEAVSAEPFTGLSGSSSSNEVVQILVQSVVAYNQGEVADPTPFQDGAVVAYLAARTPADPASFDSYRDEIASAIRNRRAQGLFRDWQAGLLAPERFTDLQRTDDAADDMEEGGDEESASEEPAPAETDIPATE